MAIRFWCILWNETLCIFNTSFALIWLWLWADFVFYELYFLWFILYMVKYIPLHDSYDKIQLSFKHLVTESSPFHKFMLVFLMLLNFVLYFMSSSSMMFIWFSYIFDYIPILFWFWFYNIELSLNISLILNSSSLGSTLGITSSGAFARDREMKVHLPWVFDIFMYLILEGEQVQWDLL